MSLQQINDNNNNWMRNFKAIDLQVVSQNGHPSSVPTAAGI
jgi:hypothetical protein